MDLAEKSGVTQTGVAQPASRPILFACELLGSFELAKCFTHDSHLVIEAVGVKHEGCPLDRATSNIGKVRILGSQSLLDFDLVLQNFQRHVQSSIQQSNDHQ